MMRFDLPNSPQIFVGSSASSSPRIDELESHVEQFLKHKLPGQVNSDIVQGIKSLIRRGEAREGARLLWGTG